MPGRQLVIVLGGFGRRLGAADRVDFGVGELFHGKCLTVTALEALVLVHREDHERSLSFQVIVSGALSALSYSCPRLR